MTGWGWPGGREEKVVAGAPGCALDTREVDSCARAVSSVAARAALVLPPVGREGGSSAAGVLAVGAAGLGSMPGTLMAWEAGVVVLAVVLAEATLVRMERRAAEVAFKNPVKPSANTPGTSPDTLMVYGKLSNPAPTMLDTMVTEVDQKEAEGTVVLAMVKCEAVVKDQ